MNNKIEQLTFSIAEIANRGSGASVTYKLDGKIDFSEYGIKINEEISGSLHIMKVEDKQYNVAIKDFKATVIMTCEKCLNEFDLNVEIPYAEHEFVVSDNRFENAFDSFYIDMKNHELNIAEFLRQEIILHFPLIAVCSPHCKGINLKSDV